MDKSRAFADWAMPLLLWFAVFALFASLVVAALRMGS
jgi:hypothetical protein